MTGEIIISIGFKSIGTKFGCVLHNYSCELVPDPPSTASLNVLGPDSIEVSFSPPVSDGGSTVTGYTVSILTFSNKFTASISNYVLLQKPELNLKHNYCRWNGMTRLAPQRCNGFQQL